MPQPLEAGTHAIVNVPPTALPILTQTAVDRLRVTATGNNRPSNISLLHTAIKPNLLIIITCFFSAFNGKKWCYVPWNEQHHCSDITISRSNKAWSFEACITPQRSSGKCSCLASSGLTRSDICRCMCPPGSPSSCYNNWCPNLPDPRPPIDPNSCEALCPPGSPINCQCGNTGSTKIGAIRVF